MTAGDSGHEGSTEMMLDLAAVGWQPGDPCPECGHSIVHAIARAGVTFRSDGSWRWARRSACTKRSVRSVIDSRQFAFYEG